MNIRCQNEKRKAKDRHRHVQLIAGRARKAQEYPRELCEAIVDGIKRQIECDDWGVVKVDMNDRDLRRQINRVKEATQQSGEAPKHDEDGGEGSANTWAWDDITGAQLDANKVKDARKEEIGYIKKHKV